MIMPSRAPRQHARPYTQKRLAHRRMALPLTSQQGISCRALSQSQSAAPGASNDFSAWNYSTIQLNSNLTMNQITHVSPADVRAGLSPSRLRRTPRRRPRITRSFRGYGHPTPAPDIGPNVLAQFSCFTNARVQAFLLGPC